MWTLLYFLAMVRRNYWIAGLLSIFPIAIIVTSLLLGYLPLNLGSIIMVILAAFWFVFFIWQLNKYEEISNEREEWKKTIEVTDKKFKCCPGCLYQVEIESNTNICPKCRKELIVPEG